MADKIAVYAGTRNIYEQMYTSLKSLLLNTQMDQFYLLIEDDEFPYPLPDIVTPVNVTDQPWFPEDGANTVQRYTYMALLKTALGEIFTDTKQILWLDCDTIIDDDISDLFEVDLTGYYYAGVFEPAKSKDIFRYVNVGVLLCNLDSLRRMGKELEMIHFINQYQMSWPEQDCINLLCQGRIRLIDSIYNANAFTTACIRPKIIHYAAFKDYAEHWAYKKYNAVELPFKCETEDDENEQR